MGNNIPSGNNVPSSGSGSVATETTEAAVAAGLIAAGTSGLMSYFHNAAARGINGASTRIAGSTATPGNGVLRLATGGAGNQSYSIISFDNGVVGEKFLQPAKDWYVSGRFAVISAADAFARVGCGADDVTGNVHLVVGFNGTASAAFFSVQSATGGAIVSTVAFDNNVHTHRCWRTGGTTFYQVDGGAIFSGTADVGLACAPWANVGDSGVAAVRTIDVIWFAASVPST